MSASTAERVEVVVIDAGPAGLAGGGALAARGVRARLLDREGVAAAWHRHYDRLHLHTVRSLSGLPGRARRWRADSRRRDRRGDGYRQGLEPLVDGLDGVLDPDGTPRVPGGDTVPGLPRLHFIGYMGEAEAIAAALAP